MAEVVILDDFGAELLRYAVPDGSEGLVEANLEGAHLEGAQLAGVNLKRADLYWAILFKADLRSGGCRAQSNRCLLRCESAADCEGEENGETHSLSCNDGACTAALFCI